MSSDTLVANDPDAWTIALVGAPRVGKTRFISRFVLDDFEGLRLITSPFEYRSLTTFSELESLGPKQGFSKQLTVDKQKTVVTLLDIYHGANDEEAAEAQLRDADAFILMYSSTSPYSLQDVVAYTRAVCRVHGQDPLLALVANQCDRPAHDQEVSLQEGTALARELDCVFVQVSAKTGEGVQAVVKDLVRGLRARGQSKQQSKRSLGLWAYLTRR